MTAMSDMHSDDELSALIRQQATRHAAGADLRAAIGTQIALADAGRATAPTATTTAAPAAGVESTRSPARRAASRWKWAAMSFALGVAGTLVVVPVAQRFAANESLDSELVADHVRALKLGPLSEVVSSDRHTVKPWFQGRVDYAPPVFDLGDQGFPLMGGRIEHVRGQAVAALVVARRQHVIDLFVWPSSERNAPERVARKGFNLVHWSDGAMQYWAVSDLERAELEHFAQLWRERAAVP